MLVFLDRRDILTLAHHYTARGLYGARAWRITRNDYIRALCEVWVTNARGQRVAVGQW